MRKIMHILLTLLMVVILDACNFRPLTDYNNTHYVRVYIDEEIDNTTKGFYRDDIIKPQYKRPEVMKVVLAEEASGRVVAEKYLRNQGDDEKVHYYDGYIICSPGEWNLMAYNFDTQSTQISDPSNIRQAKAFTNNIASHLYSSLFSRFNAKGDDDKFKDERIVYEPDHLFVVESESVKVGYSGQIDTLRTQNGQYFTAGTIVEAWYIQVNIKGLNNLSSAVSLLNGLSGSKQLINSQIDKNDPITLYFEMAPGLKTKNDPNEGILYSTFYTFGNIPDKDNDLNITFDLMTNYGKPMSATLDITEEFSKPLAVDHHWIILDKTLVIPDKPKGSEGGGFAPGVDDWGDVNTDLII